MVGKAEVYQIILVMNKSVIRGKNDYRPSKPNFESLQNWFELNRACDPKIDFLVFVLIDAEFDVHYFYNKTEVIRGRFDRQMAL